MMAIDLTDLKIINPQNGGINSSAELSFLGRLVAAVPYSYTRLDVWMPAMLNVSALKHLVC